MDGSFFRLKSQIDKWIAGDPSGVLDSAALDDARRLWEAAAPAGGDAQAVPVDVLMVLAYLHLARSQELPEEDEEDFDIALEFFSALVERAPERVPDEIREFFERLGAETADANRLGAEGTRLLREYEQTGDTELLDTAVAILERGIKVAASVDPGQADVAGLLSNLSIALMTRFDRSGDDADLAAAIDFGQQAVTTARPGSPTLTMVLSNLAAVLARRFQQKIEGLQIDSLQVSDLKDLDDAIEVARRAVAESSAENPVRIRVLSNLAGWLDVRSKLLRDQTSLDSTIILQQEVVDSAAPGDTKKAARLSQLAESLRTRFGYSQANADLDAAIDAGRQAVDAAPPGDPDLAVRLSDLAVSLGMRFEHAGDAGDLDAAIDAGRQAVDATLPGDPDLAVRLSDLAVSLGMRFEHAGDAGDLDAAIDAGRQAVDAAPPGGAAHAWSLATLATSLVDRFNRTRDNADLDAAVDAGRQAVEASPRGHRYHAKCLSVMGRSLSSRYEQTGNTIDLDEAIDAERQAVATTPPDDPRHVKRLSNLAVSLTRRFQHSGNDADLDAAIKAQQQAVNATPTGDPYFFKMLYNLSRVLHTRFERTKNGADLDAAIDAAREAVAATTTVSSDLAEMLSALGTSLRERHERTGDSEDLDEAIETGRQAVDMAAASQHYHLANLGLSLRARFECAGAIADLDAAIDIERRAVAAFPADHPALADALSNLGVSLLARFASSGDPGDLNGAIDCWQRAASVPTAKPHVRLLTAIRWGRAAARAGRMHDATEAYAAAIAQLEVVAWHGMDRITQQKQLARFHTVAADAATCAILVGRPDTAVEFLEQGRSVLWNQALNLRSDLAYIAERSPHLAERLNGIRQFLDTPLAAPPQALDDSTLRGRPAEEQLDLIDHRRRMAREWDAALIEARTLDGFEHFLEAPPYSELAAAQADGPTVIVNASIHGCHALIITANSARPEVISLPDLTIDSVLSQADKLQDTLRQALHPQHTRRDWVQKQYAVLEVLEWLWETVAEPVLAALGYIHTPAEDEPWPRLWWCPTGPLTMLPLHAAGRYPRDRTAGGGESHCVPDRIVSSYTPTMTTLIRACQPRTPAQLRHLTVGMPTTPGQTPLPGVPLELEVLARHFPPGPENHQLSGPEATRASVLAATSDHSWIHMACHALQEDAAPDRSGFALWDGRLNYR